MLKTCWLAAPSARVYAKVHRWRASKPPPPWSGTTPAPPNRRPPGFLHNNPVRARRRKPCHTLRQSRPTHPFTPRCALAHRLSAAALHLPVEEAASDARVEVLVRRACTACNAHPDRQAQGASTRKRQFRKRQFPRHIPASSVTHTPALHSESADALGHSTKSAHSARIGSLACLQMALACLLTPPARYQQAPRCPAPGLPGNYNRPEADTA